MAQAIRYELIHTAHVDLLEDCYLKGGDPMRVAAVADALEEGTSSRDFMREDYELVTDVQELDLIRFGTPLGDLSRVMQQLRSGRDESSRAAYRILRQARDGELGPTDQALVAAAVQMPHAYADARRRLVRPAERRVWESWAALVTEPARERLLILADTSQAAA